MVVLIFEGCDNLGKTTLINKIVNKYRSTRDIILMHSMGPAKDCKDPFEFQKNMFTVISNKIAHLGDYELYVENKFEKKNKNIVFLDRSWFGEYVYGQIYRNIPPDKIIQQILNVSNINIYGKNVYPVIVYLDASAQFIYEHDDGLSLSSNEQYEQRIQHIEHERELFKESFEVSCVKIPIISVTIEDELNPGKFKDPDKLCNQILDTIINKLKIEL